MRILGYFLTKKYGIDPASPPPSVHLCSNCGKENWVPATAKRVKCGACHRNIALDRPRPESQLQQPLTNQRAAVSAWRKQFATGVAIAAALMLVYAPWSECYEESRTCYAQQVANAASPYFIPPNYWFFWEVPADRLIDPGKNPFLESVPNRESYGAGWRLDLYRLSRQFAALGFFAVGIWWFLNRRSGALETGGYEVASLADPIGIAAEPLSREAIFETTTETKAMAAAEDLAEANQFLYLVAAFIAAAGIVIMLIAWL